MEPKFLKSDEVDVTGLLDSTLLRANFWTGAPPVLDLWEAFKQEFRAGGELRELLFRAIGEGDVSSLAGTAGLREWKPDEFSGNPPELTRKSGGFLSFLPAFEVPETMAVRTLVFRTMPWLLPSMMGFIGFPERDPDDRQWIFTFEQPVQLLGQSRSDKYGKERLHIDRFCTDYLLRHQSVPYDKIERGNEPPDFLCVANGVTKGVECTQLTVAERRRAFGLFKNVRASLVAAARQSRSRFAALAGLIVFLRFESENGLPDFPPAASDKDAVNELVEKLSEFRPEIEPTWVEGGEIPETAPPISFGTTSFGCRFHAAPFTNALPDSPFFTSTGFELAFGLRTIHRPSSAWAQIADLVSRKDVEGTDDLIITLGGPDQDGYTFPSEEALAEIALLHDASLPPTVNLTSVRLHFWSTGRIVQLLPERAELVEPIYRGGLVPTHLHLGPPLDSAPTE